MMLRKSYKCLGAKNMIIELGLVFQNLKLANEMNVLAIETKFVYRWLNGLSPMFWMFKYFLNIYGNLVLNVQKSCEKNQSNWNKFWIAKIKFLGTFGGAADSTRPGGNLPWDPHDPGGIGCYQKCEISFLSFACPIQLIPVPMVLVKIIKGKFGIIEIFGNTQGYFGHLVTIFVMFL
jgi:hypothetical protein